MKYQINTYNSSRKDFRTAMGNTEMYDATSSQIKQIYSIYSSSLIRKQKLKPDHKKISKEVLRQLFQSFTRYKQYPWSEQITPLFLNYFIDNLNTLWNNDKEIFYRQMIENSGLRDISSKTRKTYESEFYSIQQIKIKSTDKNQQQNQIKNRINALNCSIIDENDSVPIVMSKKIKNIHNAAIHHSMFTFHSKIDPDQQYGSKFMSEYCDSEIMRSSLIVPETIFIERLDEETKQKVTNMLDFYKIFSESLQQMIRNISLMACPLKHFQIYLKKKVRIKKIKSSQSSSSILREKDTRKASLLRKKKQYNNTYLLIEIRDFTQAYTQFIWKYLNLYRFAETQFSNFITLQTAYGIVLKIVWSFTSWIGQRGYQFQQTQISKALQILSEQQKNSTNSAQKKKNNKKQQKIQISDQIIKLGCQLSQQTNPQKYLKQIVIIYRQMSKLCTNADQLIMYYESLFQEISKRNCCSRIFRMQSIIDKLLKMEDSCGQICYAWTTWNIMVQTIRKIISDDTREKKAEEDFQLYLNGKAEKTRLSG